MTIAADALIFFQGTQDEVTVASPGAVADNAFSAAGDTTDWTNDDDAPLAGFVLDCAFGVAPTTGSIDLYAQPMNILTTNDAPVPSANYKRELLGSFRPEYTVATQRFLPLFAALPWYYTSQVLHFFIHNNGTGQTITAATWQLFVTPITQGPKPAP